MRTPVDRRERAALCDLFDELGPDAPTLCGDWTTFDLVAHLHIREADPRSGPGIVLGGRFAEYTDRLQQRAKDKGYAELVERVRSGPPLGMFAVPKLGNLMNLNEYVVHHEDVRRANGLPTRDDAELDAAVARFLGRAARMLFRNVRTVGVELLALDGARMARTRGSDHATLVGGPLELLLYANGRRDHAAVEVTGTRAAVHAVETASLGI